MNLEGINKFILGPELLFGEGSLNQIPNIIKNENFRRIMVICDAGIKRVGILNKVVNKIQETGVDYIVFSDVEANPTTENVDNGTKELNNFNPDLLIGLGGGSPIDVAKALGVIATNGGNIIDYEGVDKFKRDGLPIMAIPTTAGTGSEATMFTVITNTETDYKLTVSGKKLNPKWAILDPSLTTSMPAHITASTGFDALVHAIESYTSKLSYALTESLSLDAIRIISKYLRQAVFSGDNIKARKYMLYGSFLAGVAFNNTRLGNVHAMSHPLSAIYNVPHGVANSILLPYVMNFNLPATASKFVDIAEAMGEDINVNKSVIQNANKAVKAIEELSRDINIPRDFSEYNIKEEDIVVMAKDAMKSGNVLVNPRTTDLDDIINLYKSSILTPS